MNTGDRDSADLRQVFDAMVDGVLRFDRAGHIVMANRAACRMLGWDPSGRELAEIGLSGRLFRRDGAAVPAARYPAVRALGGDTVRDEPLLFHTAAGAASVLASASPLVMDGSVTGAIVSFHDVTSLEVAQGRLRETAQLSAALIRIGRIVNSTLDAEEIMQPALRETCDAVGAETAAIVMREDGAWATRYTYRFASDIIGDVVTDEEVPHAAIALATGAPVAIDDAFEDPRVNREVMERYGVRSVLTMPLIVQAEVVGVMFMNHHSAPVAFTAEQIGFAANASTTISLALHNARLYAAQRDVAETLQQAMLTLPEHLPGVEYSCIYRSATESVRVGGDFYGLFQLPRERVGIAIGDVSGKGLEAAATASVVKNTVRAYALAGDSPAEVLRKTNEVMGQALDTASFVTLLFGVLDVAAGEFSYASAGHPPAALLAANGDVRLLREGGTVIGPFPASVYVEDGCAIGPGDLLVLYTDGLTEARRGHSRYGEDRLLEALRLSPPKASAEHLAQHIFFDAFDFADGHLSDDLALLTVRLAPEP